MFDLPYIEYLPLVSAVAAVAFAVFVFSRGTRGVATFSLAAGFLLFGLQEVAVFLTLSASAGGTEIWVGGVRWAMIVRLIQPVPWLIFGITFGEREPHERVRRWTPALCVMGGLALAAIPFLITGDLFRVVRALDISGGVVVPTLAGRAWHFLVVLEIAAVLFSLESLIRHAKGKTRASINSFIVGLFAAFAAQIYALSHILLVSHVQPAALLVESAGILIATGFVAVAVVRNRLFQVQVYVSRQVVYRSATVGLVGGYFVVLGLAAEAFRRFDIPMRDFFYGVGGLVALLALAVMLSSERARRRVKYLIDTNFYRHKYDHRGKWEEFTRTLGPAVRMEDVLSRLLDAVMRTVWVERAAVFLADGRDGDLVVRGVAGPPPGPDGCQAKANRSKVRKFESSGVPLEARTTGHGVETGCEDDRSKVRTFESSGGPGDGRAARQDERPNARTPERPNRTSDGGVARIRRDGELWRSLHAGQVVDVAGSSNGDGREIGEMGLALLAPMKDADGLVGVLAVGPERSGKAFTAEDHRLLGTIAGQAGTAIQTARLSQELAAAKSMEAVHRVATFLLHDLKNCASVITMVAEHARKRGGDPEFQREAVEAVASTAPKMRNLIATLSGLRESSDLEREAMDLQEVAGEALETIRKGLGPQVALKTDLRSTPRIQGDPAQIGRVVTNLLVNAAEAVGEVGEISVETYPEGSWACVRVRDTGPGIPEAQLRNGLFQPFKSTKPGGLGIGLYQCKTIVEGHGGYITVHSVEGAGCTFTVYLPSSQQSAVSSQPANK